MDTRDTHRLQLTLHYDGSDFHGWQFQPDQRTVQGELQATLAKLTGDTRTVVGSGRTDTGVHALGQVASVDLPLRWTPAEVERALNATLPRDIWVAEVRLAPEDFHPRFHAVARSYEYRIGTRRESRSPFWRGWCWALGEPLDPARLQQCADGVVGDHSFAAFAKAGQPERGDRCVVAEARWSEWDMGVRFHIRADRYLHHMVRYLVGTMVAAAQGRRPLSDVAELLEGRTGLLTSPPAPPEGLFLLRVEYPHDGAPAGARTPPQRRTTAPTT